MIGNRMIFVVLTLVIIVSTAPILDIQLYPTRLGVVLVNETIPTTEPINYDDNSNSKESNETSIEEDIQSTTVQYQEETTTKILEVIIHELHFDNNTDIPLIIDEILELTNSLVADNQDELPSTPTTDSPEVLEDDE